MTHLQVVQEVRATFPTPLYPEQSGAFLVALCKRLHQVFPDEPAGLRRKDAGTHTTLPDGTNVALDIVMYPTGAAYDALGDADGAATPAWNKIEDLPVEWYVAVDGTPTPPPEDPCADLTREVAALIAQMAHLQQQINTLEREALRDGTQIALGTHHNRFIRAWRYPFIVDQSEEGAAIGPWEIITVRKV